jgi:hypothetical protein
MIDFAGVVLIDSPRNLGSLLRTPSTYKTGDNRQNKDVFQVVMKQSEHHQEPRRAAYPAHQCDQHDRSSLDNGNECRSCKHLS